MKTGTFRLYRTLTGLVVAGLLSTVAGSNVNATAGKEDVKVSIADFAFAPPEITIAPGETVTWTNDDGAPHGLEFGDGAAGNDLLLPGASYSRGFAEPGKYDYSCSIHPYMTGRVIVQARG